MNERVLLSAAVATVALAFGPASASAAPATDGPGAMSHFALARKDCVGTARNDRSKVWFTVADGVLSDVYYPTNDNTKTRRCSTSSPTADVHRPADARHDLQRPGARQAAR